jgi:hypothetical protein
MNIESGKVLGMEYWPLVPVICFNTTFIENASAWYVFSKAEVHLYSLINSIPHLATLNHLPIYISVEHI